MAGAWVLVLASRSRARRIELAVYGAAVASNALGGFGFHGWQTAGARWVHDVAILSVLVFIAAFGAARTLDRDTRWTMRVYALTLGAIAGIIAAVPEATPAPFAAYVVVGSAASIIELLEIRRELPSIREQGITAERKALLGALAAFLLGTTAFFVGRTGGLLCEPSSPMQWHAVWHVAAATAMALYASGRIAPARVSV